MLTDFFFPPVCFHCNEFTHGKAKFLCETCALYFEPLKPIERCFYCFKESQKKICHKCRKKKSSKVPMAYLWENFGPVTPFVTKMQKENIPAFIKMASSFLVAQMARLYFPEPAFITTTSTSWFEKLYKGKSSLALLSKEFSAAINVPLLKFPPKHDLGQKNLMILDVFLSREKINNMSEILLTHGAALFHLKQAFLLVAFFQ